MKFILGCVLGYFVATIGVTEVLRQAEVGLHNLQNLKVESK